jgi:hypothetical protein
MSSDWNSAARTPRKRYTRNLKKALVPGWSPIAQYLFVYGVNVSWRGKGGDVRDDGEEEGAEEEKGYDGCCAGQDVRAGAV